MNVLSTIVLMSILTIGGMGLASDAFADHHQQREGLGVLYVVTDSDTYDHESVIAIDGSVANTARGTDVTIVITGPMGIVQIAQVPVSSDGSFSTTVKTSSCSTKDISISS